MENLAPTPMLRQYLEIKKSYPDAILFFRLGDFYEMFFDDARTAAPILEVVLTSRNKNKEDAVPLCGVPHHAWENYAAKLLRKGFKVAICEQVEDPALAKGIVRREVTHILTPATALEVEALDSGPEQFHRRHPPRRAARWPWPPWTWPSPISRSRPSPPATRRRCSTNSTANSPRKSSSPGNTKMSSRLFGKRFPEFAEHPGHRLRRCRIQRAPIARRVLKQQFHLDSIEGLGLAGHPAAVAAAGVMLKYLRSIRRGALAHVLRPALQRQRRLPGPGRRLVPQPGDRRQPAKRHAPPVRCSGPST